MVGVDGSAASDASVVFGAAEAKRRHVPLLLVHGYVDAIPHLAYSWAQQRELTNAVRDDARRMLTDVELRAHAANPNLTVRSTLVAGGGASTLVELSRGTSLVVVGARGRGGFPGLRLGSVGAQVVAHAHAPVVVVRPAVAEEAAASVVVGIDGSPSSDRAIGFAFEEAALRGVPVVVLTTQEETDRMLAEAVGAWSAKYPEVIVRRIAVHNMNPAQALVEASRDAAIVIVGNRGRGGFAGMVLGSVSRKVVDHAHCPVAVVREIEE